MSKLYQYHNKDSKYSADSNVVPMKVIDNFGTVIDKQYADNGGLQVLSVLPYSLASKLGLTSGDIITEFAGDSIMVNETEPLTQLMEYLGSIDIRKKISMTIIRSGQALTLNSKYTPIILPEISYQVGLNSSKSINH